MEDDKKAAHVKVRGSVGAIGFGGDRSFRSDVGDPFRLGGNSVCLLRVSVRSICVMCHVLVPPFVGVVVATILTARHFL